MGVAWTYFLLFASHLNNISIQDESHCLSSSPSGNAFRKCYGTPDKEVRFPIPKAITKTHFLGQEYYK